MPKQDIAHFSLSHLQVLDEAGHLDKSLDPGLDSTALVDLYRAMLLTRQADKRMLNLQRQGRLGTFAPVTGQEAAFCAPAAAMGPKDWLVTSYRETGARLMRGESLDKILLYYNGYEEGAATSRELRMLPPQVILGAQTLHAVGIAYAIKVRHDPDEAVLTFFGDGASSEGDVAEALNFAGVWRVPVVFICQNNGWAISTPRCIQTGSQTIAQKAIAFGFEGVQVDGNDPLAMYKATSEALAKAKAGEGPTLIEAMTYRMLMHTTADDPTKYRDEAEVKIWEPKDPLIRFRSFLRQRNLLNEDLEHTLDASIQKTIDEAISKAEAEVDRKPDANFDHVFAEESSALASQRAEFLENVKREKDNG